jgi:hypothetical protein
MTEDVAIEEYLDELTRRLRGDPASIRRVVREAETHLCEGKETHERAGMASAAAEHRAIEEFGTAAAVAASWNAMAGPGSAAAFAPRLAARLGPLVAVGCLAIGASALLARLMTVTWGSTFMWADPPGTKYSAADCHYWLSIHPHAGSCTGAYIAESMADGLQARYLVGVCGLLVAAALIGWRRRRNRALASSAPAIVSLLAAAVFGVAAVGLGGLALDAIRINDGNGAGQWLSGAIVALPVAAFYSVLFVRHARRDPMTV